MAKNKKQPKDRSLPIVLVGVAFLLLIVAVILLLSGKGPAERISKAAEKTLQAGNFTAKFVMDVNGNNTDGTVKAVIDPAKKDLQVYMQMTSIVSDYECGIYDGSFFVCTATTGDVASFDIQEQVDNFFLLLEKNGQPDWSVLLDLNETNLHDAISKDFNFDTFLSCMGQWLNKLNDTSWAEKNAGYAKEKADGATIYRFNPDPYTLAVESIPLFRPAFREESRYEALNKYVDDAKYLFKDGKADLSVGAKSGYLDSAALTLQYHNTKISGDIRFSNIGTTQVDINTLANYVTQGYE